MRISDAARSLLLPGLLTALLLPACTRTVVVDGGSSSSQAVAPTMVIERFLRASNQNDLDTMASLFGTTDGPITKLWPSKQERDERMFVLASLLRHTDYSIGGQQIVPGRRDEAVEYPVTVIRNDTRALVPFRMVQADGAWLVEFVCVERLSQGPQAACR